MRFKKFMFWGLVLCAVLSCCAAQQGAGATEGNPLAPADKKGRHGDTGATFFTEKGNPPGCSSADCGNPFRGDEWDRKAAEYFAINSNNQGRKKRAAADTLEMCQTEMERIWWVRFIWTVNNRPTVMWAYIWTHIPWTKCLKNPNQKNYCDAFVYNNNNKYCCDEDMKVMPIMVIMRTPHGHPLRPRDPKCFWSGNFPSFHQYCFVRLWVEYPACCSCKPCKPCF